jgi:uncharacterized damage-inducible protein DinB
MTFPFPEATDPAESRTEVFLRYLDYFRSVVVTKVDGLSDEELRSSRLPSGWSPLELVKHLTYVEQRWLEWGFEGHDVPDPWGDSRDGRWHVDADESSADVVAGLEDRGRRSREIVERHDLSEVGQPSDRWDGADPPTLERVLLHLLQEYARHAGHLDIVRELVDGTVGEG